MQMYSAIFNMFMHMYARNIQHTYADVYMYNSALFSMFMHMYARNILNLTCLCRCIVQYSTCLCRCIMHSSTCLCRIVRALHVHENFLVQYSTCLFSKHFIRYAVSKKDDNARNKLSGVGEMLTRDAVWLNKRCIAA